MKALIVDDSKESRMLLGKILSKSFAAEIVEAVNGKDAMRKLSSEKPDIVFLDYEMPTMNGKEALKMIRSNPAFQDLPVVIVTSHSEKELVRELLSYKVAAYIVKPISSEYTVKRVSLLLSNPDVKR